MSVSSLDQLCVNTIRTLSIDAVQKANSGHPGMPMGIADVAYVLWTRFLKHNPENPDWVNRDRFVLSAGHGSMLLYSLLHVSGYDLSIDEIKKFRQLGSKTPGHPENTVTPGVEMTTGPLGQGFATGVGMAMAETFLASSFNTPDYSVIDHFTYAIVSDGDLMEGISHEAASLAGHLKLGKLIYLYDSNRISIDGSTDLAFTEDVAKRFEAYGWHIQTIDGHNHDSIEAAITEAKDVHTQPSLIICKTHIGFGSPNKQDSASSHGSPLGEEEVILTKKQLRWEADELFHVPDEVVQQFRSWSDAGSEMEEKWKETMKDFEADHPELAVSFKNAIHHQLPVNFEELLPVFETDETGLASRKSSGLVLTELKEHLPNLIGGSADLTGSNNTELKDKGIFTPNNRTGQNVHYGVREHAMAAAANGMALHGGVIPYTGTFFIFTDYMRPAIRLGALMETPSIFVLTHDSIGLGEDGPTHQPVEHLASLRAMPNVTVIRPGDANEVAYAWKNALERTDGPTLLVLTRQNIPTLPRTTANAASLTERGAYVYRDTKQTEPEAILIASGSELHLAIEAQNELLEQGVNTRVVSMPSWELFQQQDKAYQESVLPSSVIKRVAVEAGSTFGWERWVGSEGKVIGMDTFGESGPYKQLYEHFGITRQAVIEAVLNL
ncbi:MAG: transketolase [Bacteroidota bacterium]